MARQRLERDPEAVLRFLERYAGLMVEAGIPRMPARVFAALFGSDSGRLTAAEIGELLTISPAAVSGAVRYLGQVGLVSREREPGSRRDVFALHNDVWFEAILDREQLLKAWQNSMREGATVLGSETPAGRRLADGADFFHFMRGEMPAVLERWREHRAQRDDQ